MNGAIQIALARIGLATTIIVAVKEIALAIIAADKEKALAANQQKS